MPMPGVRKLLVALVCFMQVGCGSVAGRENVVGRKAEEAIGKRFSHSDFSRPTGATVTVLRADPAQREIEYKFKNGCAVALLVDVPTDIIASWRYTSAPEPCIKMRSYTFGT